MVLLCIGAPHVVGAPPRIYRQCDPRWASDVMGVPGRPQTTLCRDGAALTSLAMALDGAGYVMPESGAAIDPRALNKWLVGNGGYRCRGAGCADLVPGALDVLTGGRARVVGEWPASALSNTTVCDALEAGVVSLVAHVHNPINGALDHHVLLTACTGADYAVRDPYYNVSSYARGAVADVLQHELLPPNALVPVPYRLLKQCDPAWGSDTIPAKTVCAVGCLMSSVSMALRQRDIEIPDASGVMRNATPGALNAWLLRHAGV